jgi:hypothetical protein
MPCHPARARAPSARPGRPPVHQGQLRDRTDDAVQPVACGIDPGATREGVIVKSSTHTYLNIDADAVTHVRDAVAARRQMRMARRFRTSPCRPARATRARGGIPPSPRARWQGKLRVIDWLCRLYPISTAVVENIAAETRGQRRWDASFSSLEVGKP